MKSRAVFAWRFLYSSFLYFCYIDLIIWNICGIVKKDSVRAVHFLNWGYKPVIMVIVELKLSGRLANVQIGRLGFSGHHWVKVEGFNRGIWLLWHPHFVGVTVMSKHFQCLNVHLSLWNGKSWYFLAVYGSQDDAIRSLLWQGLNQISAYTSDAWLLAGDFNSIKSFVEITSVSNYTI